MGEEDYGRSQCEVTTCYAAGECANVKRSAMLTTRQRACVGVPEAPERCTEKILIRILVGTHRGRARNFHGKFGHWR